MPRLRGRWYGLDARWLVRPDQQHRARGVVDDKACGRAQAVGTEARTVAVASHHKKVDSLGDCADNLALDPSSTMEQLRVLPPEPFCRAGHDRRGRLVSDLLEVTGGPVPPKGPPKQPGARGRGDFADIGGGDVKEPDICSGGGSGGQQRPGIPLAKATDQTGPRHLRQARHDRRASFRPDQRGPQSEALQATGAGCRRLRMEAARHHPQHLENVGHWHSDLLKQDMGPPAKPGGTITSAGTRPATWARQAGPL